MPQQSDTFKGWGTTGSSPGNIGGLFISQGQEFPAPDASTHQQRTCAALRVRTPEACSEVAKGTGAGETMSSSEEVPSPLMAEDLGACSAKAARAWTTGVARFPLSSWNELQRVLLLGFVVILLSLRQILPPPSSTPSSSSGLPKDSSTSASLGCSSAPLLFFVFLFLSVSYGRKWPWDHICSCNYSKQLCDGMHTPLPVGGRQKQWEGRAVFSLKNCVQSWGGEKLSLAV